MLSSYLHDVRPIFEHDFEFISIILWIRTHGHVGDLADEKKWLRRPIAGKGSDLDDLFELVLNGLSVALVLLLTQDDITFEQEDISGACFRACVHRSATLLFGDRAVLAA